MVHENYHPPKNNNDDEGGGDVDVVMTHNSTTATTTTAAGGGGGGGEGVEDDVDGMVVADEEGGDDNKTTTKKKKKHPTITNIMNKDDDDDALVGEEGLDNNKEMMVNKNDSNNYNTINEVGGKNKGMGGGDSTITSSSSSCAAPASAAVPPPPPSFSMTLAIGPDDARRVYRASNAFNTEIRNLQQQQQQAVVVGVNEKDTMHMIKGGSNSSNSSSSSGGGDETLLDDDDDKNKKKPAIVHSPPSREGEPLVLRPNNKHQASNSSSSSSGGDGGGDDCMMIINPPPAHIPPLRQSKSSSDEGNITTTAVVEESKHITSTEHTATTTTTGSSSNTTTATSQQQQPLRNLLIPAAKNTNDPLLQFYMTQMEEGMKLSLIEQQTSLLFFLDADKSTKLLAAFDVLSSTTTPPVVVAAAASSTDAGSRRAMEDEEESNNNNNNNNNNNSGRKKQNNSIDDDDYGTNNLVERQGLICLFQSFLTSISTCVHGGGGGGSAAIASGSAAIASGKGMVGKDEEGEGNSSSSRAPTPTIQNTSPSTTAAAAAVVGKSDGITSNKKTENVDVNMDPNNSNDGDWKGSGQTQREILDVATFAADNLIEYAKKDNNYKTTTGNDGIKISFDLFGKWYNSGGFTHVPWLELLDLSKWDYTDDGGGDGVNNYSSLHQSSSSKRARMSPAHNIDHPLNTPTLGGISNMREPIGSPTNFFTSGAMIVATPHPPTSTTDGGGGVQSFSAMFGERNESSRTVVSFDFSGSDTTAATTTMGGGGAGTSSFHIDITEENLVMLGNLVRRTGFSSLTPQHVESLMMKHARAERHKYGETIYVISRAEFGKFIRDVVPKESSKNFDPVEIENFSNYFTNFFTCYDYSWSELKKDEVNAKELLVGFTFLFAGNKSSKLAASYEILDVDRVGYLTQRGLMQYLRSYLTMLAGISLLSASKKTTTQIRKRLMSSKRDDAFLAVENGAKWTLSHFLRQFEQELERGQRRNSTRTNAVTFEDFAKWYTEGGYAVAPWLELLDLHKFLSLIGESSKDPPGSKDESLSEVLFTFPLAKGRSLIVLRDDAHYVRSVVSELGLLSLTSEDIWSVLFNDVANSIAAEGGPGKRKNLRMEVDQMTFVNCMMRILSGTGKIRQNSSQWPDFSPEDTLKNFYLSFDLSESKRVPLHQLMCGLTLLCGGKKSNKLVFAFGLFCSDDIGKNGKKKSSMIHNDFFYFFRSFLIVMFSCCNQSLSLSAEVVTQYISDTAKQVADDVMAYWKIRNVEKVKFENFSEWYNEGGFETAPWLELLDLTKWVLADQVPIQHQQQQHHQYDHAVPPTPAAGIHPSDIDGFGLTPGAESIRALWATPRAKINGSAPNTGNLPLGPDDDFDLGILDAEEDAMDLFLQQESGAAHHGGHVDNANYMYPIAGQTPSAKSMEAQNALKFNLLTHDQFGGYIISIGQNQVQLLHRIVTKTGLYLIDAPTICKFILYDTKSRRQVNLSRKSFQSAMKRVFDYAFKISPSPISSSIEDELSDFTTKLFISLDNQKTGKINAVSVACGFSVLCGGRKSDKLEYVFELLDEDKDTLVSKQDINRFISSFLVMLLSVSSSFAHLYGDGVCSNDPVAITRAIEAGSDWATTQVFDALQSPSGRISFDDFADWYTKGGYQSIPWLELLDLRKWVLGET